MWYYGSAPEVFHVFPPAHPTPRNKNLCEIRAAADSCERLFDPKIQFSFRTPSRSFCWGSSGKWPKGPVLGPTYSSLLFWGLSFRSAATLSVPGRRGAKDSRGAVRPTLLLRMPPLRAPSPGRRRSCHQRVMRRRRLLPRKDGDASLSPVCYAADNHTTHMCKMPKIWRFVRGGVHWRGNRQYFFVCRLALSASAAWGAAWWRFFWKKGMR